MTKNVCDFRWSTFETMIEELEDFRYRGGEALKQADVDEAIICYDTARRMISFFSQTGELVRQFQLNNDPQRQMRFTQMRFEIASDLTMAHFTSMNKNRPCSSKQAEATITSAIIALRYTDDLWRPDVKQEAPIHFMGGCAQKMLNKLEDPERSLLRALEMLKKIESRRTCVFVLCGWRDVQRLGWSGMCLLGA